METGIPDKSGNIGIKVPTRWGSQLNGNRLEKLEQQLKEKESPHSLGIPIEWKLYGLYLITVRGWGPHSLGIPIEWKRSYLWVVLNPLIKSPLAGDPN